MDNNYVIRNGELYHWGVKGMRWGVRRAQKQTARMERKAQKKGWSEDAKTAALVKTKSVKQMSNTELRKLNERIQLEKQYKNITKGDKSAGSKFVADVLKESAKDTVKSYTTKYMKKGVDFIIDTVKSK